MPRVHVETFHDDDGLWHNQVNSDDEPRLRTYWTRDDAVAAGKRQAKKRRIEHVVRRLDGTVAERHRY